MNVIALVTARGGSKSIPRKNITLLNGKPLIAYSIEAALGSKCCSVCYVSTEDEEIARISEQYGARVIERPEALALDTSRSEEAMLHALHALKDRGEPSDAFVLLQPTSPLRMAHHIDAAFELFHASQARSLMSVTEVEHSPYKMLVIQEERLKLLFERTLLSTPRQQLPMVYRQNGAIYIMKSADFLESHTFFTEPVVPFIMSHEDSIDIDSPAELQRCESILRNRSNLALRT